MVRPPNNTKEYECVLTNKLRQDHDSHVLVTVILAFVVFAIGGYILKKKCWFFCQSAQGMLKFTKGGGGGGLIQKHEEEEEEEEEVERNQFGRRRRGRERARERERERRERARARERERERER
jgi:hypothetical protein